MENLVEQLRAYLASATKEQLERDWEELEPWSNVGPELFSFIDEQMKLQKCKYQEPIYNINNNKKNPEFSLDFLL